MLSLHHLHPVVEAACLFLLILGRYFVVAGLVFWMLGRFFRNGEAHGNSDKHIFCDIRLSVQSAVVFAVAAEMLVSADRFDLTRLYGDPQQYGWWYLGVSYVVVLMLQDTCFYFSHRLFHHPHLYRWFHASHHQSRQPTAWTSFAFDTPEAVFQAGFLLVIVMVLPLHWGTLIAVLATMSSWAVVNHLGLEQLPVSFPHGWLGRWFIGPAHHALHHRQPKVHFGLYFTFWDHLLGTEHPEYLQSASTVSELPQNMNHRLFL